MRILFDSKQLQYKSPFGTLVPQEECTLTIHIPATVQTTAVECRILYQDNSPAFAVPMEYKMKKNKFRLFISRSIADAPA